MDGCVRSVQVLWKNPCERRVVEVEAVLTSMLGGGKERKEGEGLFGVPVLGVGVEVRGRV